MKVILQNSELVFKTVEETTFNYLSSPEFISNHFIDSQPLSVGSTCQIRASSSSNHTADVYKVPVVQGNKVKFYICRNATYPQVYVVDADMIVVQAISIPSEQGNIKQEQTIEITSPDAAFFVAGNLGGTGPTQLEYTDTYVIRYGSVG